jgi:hypothetical protein
MIFGKYDRKPNVPTCGLTFWQGCGERNYTRTIGINTIFENFDFVRFKPMNEFLDVHSRLRRHCTLQDSGS